LEAQCSQNSFSEVYRQVSPKYKANDSENLTPDIINLNCIGIKTFARLATGEEHFELHSQDIQQPLGKYQQKIACSLSDVKHKMRKKKEKIETEDR